VGPRRLLVGHLLDVVGHDDRRDRPLRARDAHRAVDEVRGLPGIHADLDVLVRDVLVQGGQIDLLLIARPQRHARLLAHDRDDRRMVELGVVEAVEEMDRAGAAGGQADPDLGRAGGAGELRVRGGHQPGELLVRHLDELELPRRAPGAGATQRADDAVDPVAGVAEDAPHAPFVEPANEEVTDSRCHDASPPKTLY